MSYDLSSSMNRLTDLYLGKGNSRNAVDSISSDFSTGKISKKSAVEKIAGAISGAEEAKEKYGKEFSEVYDSLQAMRALDQTMRTSYEMNHKDDYKNNGTKNAHSALTFSKGSSRIMDMLSTQVSTEMDNKVSKAISDGLGISDESESQKD